MSSKKRYLIGFQGSSVMPQSLTENVESFVTENKDIKCVRKLKSGQCVLEMTEEQAQQLARQRGDIIIEEDQELEMFLPMPGLSPLVSADEELSLKFKVVNENKKPISDVTIFCVGNQVTYRGKTNKSGIATVRVFESNFKHIIASPKATYWSQVQNSVKAKSDKEIQFKLKEIPVAGNYDWGHLLLGVDKVRDKFTGKGIKVAVIDSGIGDHEDLKTEGGYNTLDGEDPKKWNQDDHGHGTHCAGVIASQQNSLGVIGMAPEAEMYSLKVFPGGRFSDLVEAIEWCIENYIDVISMSLGSRAPSIQIENSLLEANARGITCVAAAGNDRGKPVSYPAKYDHVIAVAAMGQVGTFPEDSGHQLKVGNQFSPDGKLFSANFTNIGPEIDVCAPGVAILSSVPSGYAAWDGTSMACPIVSGLVALILEAYPEIRTGDNYQPYYASEILKSTATNLGLPKHRQGAGLPNAELALESAMQRLSYEENILKENRQRLEAMLQIANENAKNIESALAKLP